MTLFLHGCSEVFQVCWQVHPQQYLIVPYKRNPAMSMEDCHCSPLTYETPTNINQKGSSPISLTPIVSKVFESLVLKRADTVMYQQLGSIQSTSATDMLVEMIHEWYQASDLQGTCIRILLLDYSKAFDLHLCPWALHCGCTVAALSCIKLHISPLVNNKVFIIIIIILL